MSKELLAQLENCNLKAAAFDLVKGFEGGVYTNEIAAALQLFTKLPCSETAVNLVSVFPRILELLVLADDTFVRMTPLELRGPKLEGFEEWMKDFDSNLLAAFNIQSFLSEEAAAGHVQVGFHGLRDQAQLYQRLEQIGVRKSFFANRRQFLRDAITTNPSAFRAVVDMVCIHCVHDGRERFWNGLGAESTPQLYLQSEVMFEISDVAEEFVEILRNRNKLASDRN